MILTGAQCLKKAETGTRFNEQVLQCRGHLIKSINSALDNEREMISDSTIGGLVKLATDEVRYSIIDCLIFLGVAMLGLQTLTYAVS